MSLRLGFHYHIPAISQPDGIYTPGFQGMFIDSLAAYCEQVVCFLHEPLPAERYILDYRISAANVSLINIGPHVSVPRRLLTAPFYLKPLRACHAKLDALLMRGPSPLMTQVGQAAAGVPTVLLLVGDQLSGVSDLPQPRWRKEIIRLLWRWNQWKQRRLAKRSLTFVNSRPLYDQLRPLIPELYETRTTTLTARDFYLRDDTCASPPYRLLYAGRLDRTKGLLEMVEALSELVSQRYDLLFDLVGWPEKNDPILEDMMHLAQERGVAERITYHGYKPAGPELYAFYKTADIYMIASTHEGFPRTIWEAMAHCLPVVATRVGSIPFFLEDGENALLIPPRDAADLARAIERIIIDSSLRRRLIAGGASISRDNTLENRTKELVSHIETWIAHEPPS